MCISHIVMPFDNLQVYGKRLILLFRIEHIQYHLQTPNELDSVVMPKFSRFTQGKKNLLQRVMSGHISFNITLSLRPLSLDWLLHCFCVNAFTFCFPKSRKWFCCFSSLKLFLLFIYPSPVLPIACFTHNLWHFFFAIYITCFDCNFPLSSCIQFGDVVSNWLIF